MLISGQTLRAARVTAGISLRGMAHRTGVSYSHLSNVERGNRVATPRVVEAIRRVLAERGHVLDLGQDDGQRRDLLGLLELLDDAGDDPLGAVPALAAAEAVRGGLHDAAGRSRAEWWQQAIVEYGATHYLTAPAAMLRDLLADAAVLERRITDATGAERHALLGSAGYLAGVIALAWSNLDGRRQAHRWWRTAIDAADRSGDPGVQVWVRAWAVLNGPNIGRRPEESLALTHEQLSRRLAPESTSCALLGGLAQAQADLGDPAATATLRRLAELTERVTGEVAADQQSLFGWPEVRLRHIESYVHTALRDTAAAFAAQDRALALYDTDMRRSRAKILLHRAHCLVIDGDVSNGIADSLDVLDDLDATVPRGSLSTAVRAVLTDVPPSARKLPALTALRDRLAAT